MRKLYLIPVSCLFFISANLLAQESDENLTDYKSEFAKLKSPRKPNLKSDVKVYEPKEVIHNIWGIDSINFVPQAKPKILGDINGDGFDDFACYYNNVYDTRTPVKDTFCFKTFLAYGNSTGTFSYKITYSKIQPVGDLNADGIDDAIILNEDGFQSFYLGSISGFIESSLIDFSDYNFTTYEHEFYKLDADKDGFDDFIYVNNSLELVTVYGNSEKHLIEKVAHLTPDPILQTRFACFDFDTCQVFIEKSYSDFNIFTLFKDRSVNHVNQNVGDTIPVSYYNLFFFEDLDGDGNKELFSQDGQIITICNGFSPITGIDLSNIKIATANADVYFSGDINKDNKADFIMEYNDVVWIMNIDISASANFISINNIPNYLDLKNYTINIIPADFNNNGNKDILLNVISDTSYSYTSFNYSGSLLVKSNEVLFSKDDFYGPDIRWLLSIGDINGDGTDEIAISLRDEEKIKIYAKGDLDNEILTINFSSNLYPVKIESSDLNNDGFSDCIVQLRDSEDFSNNRIDIYYGGVVFSNTPDKQLNISQALNILPDAFREYAINTIGSIDGDSYPEMIISTREEPEKVYLFKGAQNFPDNYTSIITFDSNFGNSDLGVNSVGHTGSRAHCLGDLNNDGINDFVISDGHRYINDSQAQGCCYIFHGKTDLTYTDPDVILYNKNSEVRATRFGKYVTTGDYNADDTIDLAIGYWYLNPSANDSIIPMVYIYHGGTNMINKPDAVLYTRAIMNETNELDTVRYLKGDLVTIPDINNDNADEILSINRGDRNYDGSFYHYGNYIYPSNGNEGINTSSFYAELKLNSELSYDRWMGAAWAADNPYQVINFSGRTVYELICVVKDPMYPGHSIYRYELYNTCSPAFYVNDANIAEGNSGTTLLNFTVSLSCASDSATSVNCMTSDNTATLANGDYVQIPLTTLNFAPGETIKTITVTINGDTISETDESFFVNLSSAVNATIADPQGIGTITNDDSQLTAIDSNPLGNEKNKIILHPNPTKGNVFLDVPEEIKGEYMVNIYNLNGRKLSSNIYFSNKQELDISSLKPGIFVIQVFHKGKTWKKMLVVN